ncbi:glycoside hydrolase family 79 protein [Purpureocillium lavendulum]|uniref:Glycoside hydrolase family 79 protein n=1 Tax=Purpureocillium lavendulum TaxID=1247861 RepID=A0AB34FFQ3_9HYPO|nr:glycoside hydrolase family 79 protein [Purpureocillium lavendulum]
MVFLSFRERMKALTTMAESKGKPAVKGPPTKSAKESKLWTLVCLAREVGGDADGIQDYNSLIDEKRKLARELNDKTKEVSLLNQELAHHHAGAAKERSVLTQAFGEQYKIFDQKNTLLQHCRGEVEKLMAEMKSSNDRDEARQKQFAKLEFDAKSASTAYDRLQKKVDTMERDCLVHRTQLQAAQAERDDQKMKLRQARADLGHDSFHALDEDGGRERDLYTPQTAETNKPSLTVLSSRDRLVSLSKMAHGIVKEFMSNPEVPAASYSSLQSLQNRNPNIPLSPGATKEAILMRRAAGEAVFCEATMEHVFRPFLIPDDFRQAAEDMLDFFQDERELQRIFRHLVNQLLGDADIRAVNAAAATTDTIFTSLARQAAHAWVSEAQTAEDVVEVTMPGSKDEPLGSYEEYGARQNGKAGVANHDGSDAEPDNRACRHTSKEWSAELRGGALAGFLNEGDCLATVFALIKSWAPETWVAIARKEYRYSEHDDNSEYRTMSDGKFEDFQQADADASKESQVIADVIPLIEGTVGDRRCVARQTPLTNLDHLTDGTLVTVHA